MKLVLTRHGESQWNLENRFTGWVDVDITDKGRQEAIKGGKPVGHVYKAIGAGGYSGNVVFVVGVDNENKIVGYSILEWNVPFKEVTIIFSTIAISFIVISHSTNCSSSNRFIIMEWTNASTFSKVGSFIARVAASALSTILIIAASFV